jgi:class 3 adenylate cyclase/tetratricopeptide (TPR) repeat protein
MPACSRVATTSIEFEGEIPLQRETDATATEAQLLGPYLPNLVVRWLAETPDTSVRELDGSVVFVDVSGFTRMSERLGRLGKVGAEEVTDTIGSVFARLLALAYANNGGLLKFGGDALLMFFEGDAHEVRAVRTAAGMRAALREIGPIQTSAGRVTLRMSVGVHSGRFVFFLVGDSHRELVVAGPAATETVLMETIAEAGEIVISTATAAQMPPQSLGAPKGSGVLLRRTPGGLERDVPVPPAARVGDLVKCIPAGLREHLLGGTVDSEHRRVTVAFVRFDGLDAVLREGPEVAGLRLHELVALVQRAAEGNGVTFLGTDVDRDGGKIILIGGAPHAIGDDEERMLLTLRAIVDAHTSLAVRVGVNRGHVFAGDLGPPYRRTYTVMGDAVNVAARLMARASPGQIMSTASVLDASSTVFQTETLEPFHVKGKTASVQAFLVGPAVGSRDDQIHELPLVGRDREIEMFIDALDGIRRDEGRLLEVIGPPGIGKTRLLAEVRERAGECTVLSAACELYSSSTPYHPFRRALRSVLAIPLDAGPEAAARQLRARVEQDAPDLVPWLPLVAVPLDVTLPPTTEVEELAEEFRRAKIEESIVELLRRVLTTPTVLMFEDVHWMDEASADLLYRLVDEVAGRPWLICVTRREDETGFVARALPQVASVRLTALAESDAAVLLHAATEDAPLHQHEVAALAKRSGGNPLFLQELLRGVRDVGGVQGLPDTIEAMAVAQIDRLAPRDRRLLRQASVLGVSFTDDLLAALLEDAPDGSAWSRLAEVVVPDGRGRHRFRHALIRDAAYEGLPFSRRRELHSRVGEELVRRGVNTGDEDTELLSLHFFYAGRFVEAWRYSRAAGDRAHAKYANVEAGDFYRRALTAARHAPDVPQTDVASVLEALGEVCDRIGAYEEASAVLRRARVQLAGDPVACARLLRREAELAEASGRYVQSLRLLGKGLRSLETVTGPDAARERANLAVWYAFSRMRQGRHREAVRWCERAIEEANLAGDRESLAWAYLVFDSVSVELALATSEPYAELALSIYEEVGNLSRQATITLNLGGRAYYEGRWIEALSLYERARDLNSRTGNTANAAAAMFNIGEILCHQGHLEEAELLLQDATRIWRAAGDRARVTWARRELARVAYRRGTYEVALPQLEQARAEFQAAGAEVDAWETDLRIAECLLLRGEPGNEADGLLERVLGRVEKEGEVAELRLPRIQRLRAWAFVRQGRCEQASGLYEESARTGQATGADYEVALSLDGLAHLADLTGRGAGSRLYAESREILDRLGVVTPMRIDPLQE